jgi:hypothetical protein
MYTWADNKVILENGCGSYARVVGPTRRGGRAKPSCAPMSQHSSHFHMLSVACSMRSQLWKLGRPNGAYVANGSIVAAGYTATNN